MPSLILELDNVTNLPDGGPTDFTVLGSRSVDIGRDTYLDWTLPDPNRIVSGRHCEIRYRDGGYVLTDRSTNGTYLNGSDKRLTEPTRLKTGDTIDVGPYIIKVTVHEDEAAAAAAAPVDTGSAFQGTDSGSMWDASEAAPPAPVTEPKRRRGGTPVQGDALDWRMDLPSVDHDTPAEPPAAAPSNAWPDPAPAQPPAAGMWDDAGAPAPGDAGGAPAQGAWDVPAEPAGWGADAPPPADAWGSPDTSDDASPDPWNTPAPAEPPSWPDAPDPAGQAAEAASPAEPVVSPALAPETKPEPAAEPVEPAAEAPAAIDPPPAADDGDWEIPSFDEGMVSPAADDPIGAAEPMDEAAEPASAAEVAHASAPPPAPPLEPAAPSEPPAPVEPLAAPDGRAPASSPPASSSPAAPPAAQAMPREPGRGQPFAVGGGAPAPERSPFAPPPPREEGTSPTAEPPASSADYEAFLNTLSTQIGVSVDILRAEGPERVAQRIGHFMVHSVSGLHALLKARATSRGFLRSDRGTTVEAVGNNPLKFLPTPEDVLRVLMSPPTRTYLGMEEALDQSYQDVSSHQVATYMAMQEAVKRLLDDLGPDAVEEAAGDAGGGGSLGRMMGGGSSRKAKLWDAFKERWTARAAPYDNGMVDVFMMHFGEAYGRAMRKKQ